MIVELELQSFIERDPWHLFGIMEPKHIAPNLFKVETWKNKNSSDWEMSSIASQDGGMSLTPMYK